MMKIPAPYIFGISSFLLTKAYQSIHLHNGEEEKLVGQESV
jgi:hypothetical protein